MTIGISPGIPQVIGYSDSGDISVRIVCPFCDEVHWHGRGKPGAVGNIGHRLSHCLLNRDNPGYIIADVRPVSELKQSSIVRGEKARQRNLRIWRRGA